MSTRKTTAERIKAAKIELKQKENELKRLEQMQKEADRKARTKRLIERGAIAESLIPGAETLTHEQFKALLEKTITSQYAVKMLAEIAAQGVVDTTAKPQPSAAPGATNESRTENEARQAG